jgi:hypothetical protein
MTYETKIRIEIAGIRRSLRIAFDYHIGTVDSERQPIHDSVRILTGDRLSGTWIYYAIGARQLKKLDSRLMEHWESERGRARVRKKRARAN